MKIKSIKIKHLSIVSLLLAFFFISCNHNSVEFIKYDHKGIAYEGRIDTSDSTAAVLYWSGTSIKLNFEGTSVKALLKDENGDNYFNVIIDNDSIHIIKPDTIEVMYELAANLKSGKHSVEIYKRTEWNRGHTLFYGFQLENETKLLPIATPKKRNIEFFGNSITAGYAIEDYSDKDSPDSIFTNNYLTYAALTARHFDAKAHYTVKSGIGIMLSWFPQIMPEIYDRLNPEDPNSEWNFERFTPDLVVINLFQNDSWLVNMPEREEFKNTFGKQKPNEEFIIESYKYFVSTLRNTYPDADIICMLGTMDITREGSVWPGYIEKAVASLNDSNMHTLFIPYKNTPGHPRIEEQQQMADSLISFIEQNIEW